MSDTATQSLAADASGRPILRPVLHHFGIATTRNAEMAEWYHNVLGMEIVAQTNDPLPQMTFVTNDTHHHRGGFFSPPMLSDDPEKLAHTRVQHLAWEYPSLDELLESWDRIQALGIEPASCWCHGPSFAFYYKDPDNNTVEILADAYGDYGKSYDHTKLPEWRAKPNGTAVDPAKLLEARNAGASLDELRVGGLAGDFLPEVEPSPMSTW